MDDKYSLALTKEQWDEIICLVWLEHDFNLADKIREKLRNKYPDVDWE